MEAARQHDIYAAIPDGFGLAYVTPNTRHNLIEVLTFSLRFAGFRIAQADFAAFQKTAGDDALLSAIASAYRVVFVVHDARNRTETRFGTASDAAPLHLIRAGTGESAIYDALVHSAPTVFPEWEDVVDEDIKQKLELLFGENGALIPGEMSSLQPARKLRVGLIGVFETGKTSLVNAVVGGNLLPEGISGATTCVPTVIESTGEDGAVEVTFCPMDWQNVDDQIAVAVSRYFTKGPFPMGLRKWLETLINSPITEQRWPRTATGMDENLRKFIRSNIRRDLDDALNRGAFSRSFRTIGEAAKEIKKHVRIDDAVRDALWPVLGKVVISGAFHNIPRNVELVDLPGTGDINEFRSASSWNFARSCDQLLVLTSGADACGGSGEFWEKVLEFMIERAFDRVTVVSTRMDDVPRQIRLDHADLQPLEVFSFFCKFAEEKIREYITVSLVPSLEEEADQDIAEAFEEQMRRRSNARGFGSDDNHDDGERFPRRQRRVDQAARQRALEMALKLVSQIPVIPTSAFGFMAPEDCRTRFPNREYTGVPAVIRLLFRLSIAADPVAKLALLLSFARFQQSVVAGRPDLQVTISQKVQELRDKLGGILTETKNAIAALTSLKRSLLQQSAVEYTWGYHDIHWFSDRPSSFQCALRGQGIWSCGGKYARLINLNSECVHFALARLAGTFSTLSAAVREFPQEVETCILAQLDTIETNSLGGFRNAGSISSRFRLVLACLDQLIEFKTNIAAAVRDIWVPQIPNPTGSSVEGFMLVAENIVFPQIIARLTVYCNDLLTRSESHSARVLRLIFMPPTMNATARAALDVLFLRFEPYVSR
jgi:hypothetical protein